ncbi:hypothetical protein [Klebsiella pasteurii]|uniref:hypothetical protein n=1 Tax=Klebsiella pasteurii TaxID=2587529 RepID=UPI0032DBBCF3
MNVEQSKILRRMSVFSDSKALANAIRKESNNYISSEAAEHIDGLWQYCGELANEIKHLQTLVKENAEISIPLNQSRAKAIPISVTACTSEEIHECNPAYLSTQPEQPIAESSLQKLARIQNYENHLEQEIPKCSQVNVACHNKKEERSHVSNAPQHEYLTLALPILPNHSVQIYGLAKNTPPQFLPLAELFLTMLRDQAIRMVNAEPHVVRCQFDTFSHAATGLVSAMKPPSKEHRSKAEDQ